MAFSKAPLFDPNTFQQSLWSKALAHPARILILRHLVRHGTASFAAIAREVPLHRSTVSQHLRILRALDMINVREEYPNTFYSLNRKVCTSLATRALQLHRLMSVTEK